MTLQTHLHLAGSLLVALSLAHLVFGRYFGWQRELAQLSLLTRQIFWVHCFFIALGLALLGSISLFYADALLEPGTLSPPLLAAVVVFWSCRLVVQLFVYDPKIWRGSPFRTSMHGAFTLFWIYFVATYGAALRHVWIARN